MNILVIEQTSEGQTNLVKMIDSFDSTDHDTLDIQVSLATPQNYLSKIQQAEVVILGAGLKEEALLIAKQVKEISPLIEIIMFVSDKLYSSEAFRLAHISRVRKVIPEKASSLDLLQELVSIQEHFRNCGRTKKGQLIVVMQAKGGVGATSLIAALAELSDEARNHTLLWDLDIESKDLSRSFNAKGAQSQLVTAWINGTRELNRESLRESYISVGRFVSLLTPPHDIATGMDLIGHPDSIKTIHRVIELARISQDTIIVDTAGRLSPASGTLLRMADKIIILTDDSLLGLSAGHSFLETLLPLVKNNQDAIRIICAGNKISNEEIKELLGGNCSLKEEAWSLPAVPFDQGAEKWPGSGNTLYSLGQKQTRRAIEDIATNLSIWRHDEVKVRKMPSRIAETAGWSKMKLMFQRVSNA